MIDVGAKWSKQLYEEAREEIAQVSVPHETIKTLIAAKSPTPGTTTYEAKLAVPEAAKKIVSNPFWNIAGVYKDIMFGTRQQKAVKSAEFLPIDIRKTETEAPEFKPLISYETVNVGGFNVRVPTVEYKTKPGTGVISTTTGKVFTTTPEDYPTTQTIEYPSKSINDLIEAAKAQSPEAAKWWDTATIGNTDITFPSIEFPDILGGLGELGKWVLIGVAALAGIYLLGKSLGGNKGGNIIVR